MIYDNGINLKRNPEVLVVEDVISNYKLIEEVLNHQDINVKWAKNGKEAVEMVDSTIKIILMDIKLPIMGGFEAAEIIKKQYPNLPILAVTAYNNLDTKMVNKNCEDYITKPIDVNYIVDIVKKYIYSKTKVL